MRLTGQQYGVLQKAIVDSYDNFEFADFLRIRLGKKFNVLATMMIKFPYQIGQVIDYFDNRKMASNLVSALIADRPDILEVQQLAYDMEVLISAYNNDPADKISRQGLESLVNGDPDFPVNEIIQGIAANKRCVCRIKLENEQGNSIYGTGFLIGKDLILSNYHVFESVIKNPQLSAKVICKFDYEVDATSKEINAGTDFILDTKTPILASSAYCEFDSQGTPTIDVDWPEGLYDYALVKLALPAGELPFGTTSSDPTEKNFEKRGWVKFKDTPTKLFKGSHMFILQHPDKKPMKLAIGLSKVLGCDKREMRVRYNINTMEGSSGSPCFDHKFNWVALHNMGDPNWNPAYNQGIPSKKIVQDIQSKGSFIN